MSHVELQHITFGYGSEQLFRDLSVQFADGEFCAIVGPNGSGKTTLIKCIAGLLSVDAGQVAVNGRCLKEYTTREIARQVAYVPQRQELVFDISVFNMVMMGRNPYQRQWQLANPHDDAVVEEMLDKCNLLHLRDRSVNELSGGELQRTLIARAMAQQTPIMLLDEPLSNLDIAHKYEIMDILRHLNRDQNVLIIIILHDISMALEYATHALLMRAGVVSHHDEVNAVLSPENIKSIFQLGPEFQISLQGNVSKRLS